MSVKFSDLLSYALVASGQNALIDMTALTTANLMLAFDLRLEDIWTLFKKEISNYGRFYPIEKRFNIFVFSGSGGAGISYDFTADENNIINTSTPSTGNYPYYISKAVPVNAFGTIGGVSGASLGGIFYRQLDSNYGSPNRLIQNVIAPFRYINPPIAIFPNAGEWDVTCHYDYTYELTYVTPNTPSSGLVDVTITGLDDSQVVIFPILQDMLTAKLKENIGLSRRAYNNPKIMITNDSATMVTEAVAAYKDAAARLAKKYPTNRVG